MSSPSTLHRLTTVMKDEGQKQFMCTEMWYCTRDEVFAYTTISLKPSCSKLSVTGAVVSRPRDGGRECGGERASEDVRERVQSENGRECASELDDGRSVAYEDAREGRSERIEGWREPCAVRSVLSR